MNDVGTEETASLEQHIVSYTFVFLKSLAYLSVMRMVFVKSKFCFILSKDIVT